MSTENDLDVAMEALHGLVEWMITYFGSNHQGEVTPRPGNIMVLREARLVLERLSDV